MHTAAAAHVAPGLPAPRTWLRPRSDAALVERFRLGDDETATTPGTPAS